MVIVGIFIFLFPRRSSYETKNESIYSIILGLKKTSVYFDSTEDMFPENWWKHPINAAIRNLDEANYAKTLSILTRAASKYPATVKLTLNNIFVFKTMNFYGTDYGGTYIGPHRCNIYLTNNNNSSVFVERLFHAELPSVLLKSMPLALDEKAWIQCLPKGFNYGYLENVHVALLQLGEQLDKQDDFVLEKGFVSHYATTNLENDFNSLVKQLFVPEENFWSCVDMYDLIFKKVQLVISFYLRIDKSFTEDYFRNISAISNEEKKREG